ncbi:MAG: universal stress protein [Chloroflexia bacterium]|nr:universal stress protein [Chloroflexia bacterium]
MGSNAFSVVKHASCPVLTIPGKWNRTEFKKVVFPVRLKPGAIEKYDYTRSIIAKNKSSILIVGLAEQENPQSFQYLADLVNLFKIQLKNDNVDFSSILYHSKEFSEKVIDAAEELDADLIVITANLDYDLKAFFIGPFAQQIVNHSQRPVLSIRKTINESANELYLKKIILQNWQGPYMQFGY